MRWSVGDAVAGVHESLIGTFRTSQARFTMSDLEGKADFAVARPDF
jgi:hypothetical protein